MLNRGLGYSLEMRFSCSMLTRPDCSLKHQYEQECNLNLKKILYIDQLRQCQKYSKNFIELIIPFLFSRLISLDV